MRSSVLLMNKLNLQGIGGFSGLPCCSIELLPYSGKICGVLIFVIFVVELV